MYVAVLTEGPGEGTSTARWTYVGRARQRGHARRCPIATARPRSSTSRTPSGFPPGDYAVEILLDGKPVETRNLQVEKEK